MPSSSSISNYKPSMDGAQNQRDPQSCRHGCASGANGRDPGTAMPAHGLSRSLYMGFRGIGILISLTLIVLAVIAFRVADLPGRWLSAMLSPAINSTVAHATDLWGIHRSKQRSPALVRLFWDGGIGIGIIIAGSFLASWTAELATNGQGTVVGGVDRLVLCGVIVAAMFAEALIHIGISITGFQSWRQLRAARKTSAV